MISIEIGQRAIRMADVEADGEGFVLRRASSVMWEPSSDPREIRIQQKRALEQLKKVFQLKDNARVRVVVSSSSLFVRYVDLLAGNKQKMSDFVRHEARQQIPLPIEEVAWDYAISSRRDADSQKAILVALKKDIINEAVSILNEVNLRTAHVSLGLVNVVNMLFVLRNLRRTESAVIVDIGDVSSGVLIYHKGDLWLRCFADGSARVTDELVSQLGLSIRDAEMVKRCAPSELPAHHAKDLDRITAVVAGFLNPLCQEIERSYQFFKAEYVKGSVGSASEDDRFKLFVTGDSGLVGAEDYIARQVGFGNPVAIDSERFHVRPGAINGWFGTAEHRFDLSLAAFPSVIGSAMLAKEKAEFDVNFLKGGLIEKKSATVNRLCYLCSGICVFVAALLMLGVAMLSLQGTTQKLAAVREELQKFDQYRADMLAIGQMRDQLKRESDFIAGYISERYVGLDVLAAVAKHMPLNMWLEEYGVDASSHDGIVRVTLKGFMVSYDDFNEFMAAMKSEAYVSELKPEAIDSADGKFHFVIAVTVNTLVGQKGQL